jgi:FkbM family methyltransferase
MPTIRSSRELFGERPDAVYDVLTFVEPGLMLDVGAAAGMLTRRMLDRSPESRVVAFEPFPGNHPYLDDRVGNDPRVTIVKAAVADQTEPSTFLVGKTVSGTEPGWEKYVGYSSLGYIVNPSHADPDATIMVPTARIDDYVGIDGARFMKMDVQGGELGVLKSARSSLEQRRIDVLFVEFNGNRDVLSYILEMGFEVYDSEYLLITKDDPDLSQWDTFRSGTLSTGRAYSRGWPIDLPSDPEDYCEMFKSQRGSVGSVWTDLVGVRSGFVEAYLQAAHRAAVEFGLTG